MIALEAKTYPTPIHSGLEGGISFETDPSVTIFSVNPLEVANSSAVTSTPVSNYSVQTFTENIGVEAPHTFNKKAALTVIAGSTLLAACNTPEQTTPDFAVHQFKMNSPHWEAYTYVNLVGGTEELPNMPPNGLVIKAVEVGGQLPKLDHNQVFSNLDIDGALEQESYDAFMEDLIGGDFVPYFVNGIYAGYMNLPFNRVDYKVTGSSYLFPLEKADDGKFYVPSAGRMITPENLTIAFDAGTIPVEALKVEHVLQDPALPALGCLTVIAVGMSILRYIPTLVSGRISDVTHTLHKGHKKEPKQTRAQRRGWNTPDTKK